MKANSLQSTLIAICFSVLPLTGVTNDYPTLERVEHVLICMRSNGGQTVVNLYACSCEIDTLARQLSLDEFTEARTFENYRRMPGDRGAIFRDSVHADTLVGRLRSARAEARRLCFVGSKDEDVKLPSN